jgi:hypothetical protein
MTRWVEELERELRETPVPQHAHDYFARLRARLSEDGGDQGRTRATPAPTPGPGLTSGPRARRQAAPMGLRLAALSAAAAAVLAAVAVTWSGVPGFDGSRPARATAGVVLDRVEHALAGITSISGEVVEYGTARGRPFERTVGSFTFTSQGDYHIRDLSAGLEYTYDAQARLASRSAVGSDGRLLYVERSSDLPDPGPFFSPWMGGTQVLDRSIAAYARAVIAELRGDVPVRPVDYGGRRAWQLTVPEPLAGGGEGLSARIVVDAASGYPLVVEHWTDDGEVRGTRLVDVSVSDRIDRSEFAGPAHDPSRVLHSSERFRRLTLAQAGGLFSHLSDGEVPLHARRAGQPPEPFRLLLPSRVPDGYVLTGVTGAQDASALGTYDSPTGGQSPSSVTVVLTYSRGFDRFCVVQRWQRRNPPGSDDPFDENTVSRSSTSVLTLARGSLRGASAHLVVGLPDWPHLVVTTGARRQFIVSVAGDLTRGELRGIAESLQPAGR